MTARLRTLLIIALAAILGSLLGRLAAQLRARAEAGRDPFEGGFELNLRPQEIVPGVIAGFRISEPPWSWLRIPAWLAAFTTNLTVGALGGDLDRLRGEFERRALDLFGIELDSDPGSAEPTSIWSMAGDEREEPGGQSQESEPPSRAAQAAEQTLEGQVTEGREPSAPPIEPTAPTDRAAPGSRPQPSPNDSIATLSGPPLAVPPSSPTTRERMPGAGPTVWTSENAPNGDAEVDQIREALTRGFTPFKSSQPDRGLS